MIYISLLLHRSEGFLSTKQQENPFEPGPQLLGTDMVDDAAIDLSQEVDDASPFLSYLILENVSDLISNNSLYSIHDK